MEAARWERVERLFHGAVQVPEGRRAAYLREASQGDAELVAEVEALLAEDRGASPLDRGLSRMADDVLGDPRRLPARRTIGPYRLLRFLGEGGMGVVYLAERSDVGGRVAIKVLRDGWVSPARRERFAAEQRTLAQLVDDAIAQLHGAGSLADGTPWFAMEYVEGVPLTAYCHAHATSIEGRLELFRTVCEAVQHAHGQAVIHRDLKPSNILVKKDGSVKLLDFGVAKQLEDLDGAQDQTVTSQRSMTPAYAAPEQLGGGPVGIHTDVHALGVILYELLTERLPFGSRGRAPGEGATAEAAREPVRPSAAAGQRVRARDRRRTAWSDLDVLCLKAMHERPERRYRTVEALKRDVERFLADQPLEARGDSWRYRLGKLVRRRRTAFAAAAAALVTLVALVAFYTARLATARDAAREEAARAARIQRFMQSLFEGGDEVAGPAEDLRVLTLLGRGVEEAQALAGEPRVQAELFRTLGRLYRKLGDFERAESLLDRALEVQRRVFGERHAETAETLVELGLLHMDQARYDEAVRLVDQGLGVLRARLPAGHPSVADATGALGQVLEARGDYERAIAVDEEALRLREHAGRDSAEYSAALGQLADAHYYAGHYETADALNEEVLEATRRLYGERHPRVADVLINLGASRMDRGRYAEAAQYDRQALRILEAFHGPEHFRSASARTMLGRALVYQGDFEEGVPLLESALAIQERVNGPEHPRVASALNDLGSAALQQGRLDEAQADFERVLAIYRDVYPEEHYLHGIATSNLGSVLVAKGDYAGAEALYREAIGIFERTLSPTHLNTAIGHVKLGRALLRQGRFEEAAHESLVGHETLRAAASPSVSWLRSAREDLVAAYEALGQPERADGFRGEPDAADGAD